MKTLRGRFIISHILPILVVIPLVGVALVFLLESQVLLSELSDDLSGRARLIAAAVERQPEILLDREQAELYVTRIMINIDGEILLLGATGELLATSDPALDDRLGEIPTIEGLDRAIEGEPVVLVHYSWVSPGGTALVPVSDINDQLIGVVGVTESLEGAASQFGDLRRLILIVVIIELLLGVLLALVLARRLENPIASVTAAVGEIAEGGRIDPIPEEGPEEIKELAHSVNALASKLQFLEETRRRLLANLVHELGRPLGAIRAAIHALRRGAAEDLQTRDELLSGIEDEIKRMQPLLDDLAQLHGQVTGAIKLVRQPVSLSAWLPPLLIPWRAAALDKSLKWQARIEPNIPTVDLDPDRMGQVVGNLLSNAIKYTQEGGEVTVTAGHEDANLMITVSDTGPGIGPGEQEKVFEPFYRSQEQRRFPQGLGLGLTIARDLVEAHGGHLEISSRAGKGSHFTILIPFNYD